MHIHLTVRCITDPPSNQRTLLLLTPNTQSLTTRSTHMQLVYCTARACQQAIQATTQPTQKTRFGNIQKTITLRILNQIEHLKNLIVSTQNKDSKYDISFLWFNISTWQNIKTSHDFYFLTLTSLPLLAGAVPASRRFLKASNIFYEFYKLSSGSQVASSIP